MRRKYLLLLTLLMVLSLSFVACGSDDSPDSKETGVVGENGDNKDGDDDSSVSTVETIMYVNHGTLGELGIGDIVYDALEEFSDRTGASLNVYECNGDASLLVPTMMEVTGSGDYDLVVTGFYNMVEAVNLAAEENPDQKILVYDAEIDYSDGKNKNVRSVQSTQNEVSFLAGVMAALMTSSDAELANDDKVVGFVGAAENTAIQDFMVGYIDGVNYIDSEINILYSFVGNWTDTAKAKELALSQFEQSADISFAVCGSAGFGVSEAAKDKNVYSIGVDYDFAESLKDTQPETADHVVTSAVKTFDNIMTAELDSIVAGTLEWGSHYIYDYANGGSELVANEYYEKLVPEDIKEAYNEVAEKLAAGEIEVSTSIGATAEEIEAKKAEASPFKK